MLGMTVFVQRQLVTAVANVAKKLLHIVELKPAEKEMNDNINRFVKGIKNLLS